MAADIVNRYFEETFFSTYDQKYLADRLFICFVFVRQIFDQYEFLFKSHSNIDLSMEIYTCLISTKISDLRGFLTVEYGFNLKNKSPFSCEKIEFDAVFSSYTSLHTSVWIFMA